MEATERLAIGTKVYTKVSHIVRTGRIIGYGSSGKVFVDFEDGSSVIRAARNITKAI